MRAGKLREKIVIQQNTPTQDDYGAEKEVWTTFATRRASVEPLKGNEFFAAQQTDANLLPSGDTETYRIRDANAPGGIRNQTWFFPSRQNCIECHTQAAVQGDECAARCG